MKHYGINMDEAATGEVKAAPAISGLEAAKDVKK